MAVGFPTPQFGINIHTRMRPDVDLVAEALHAEQLGFDLVTLHGDVLHTTAPSFETWTLLKPGTMIRSRGLFDLTAMILKGPNQAFRRKQIQVTEALDTSRLYLLNNGNTHALELVPFIRVLTGTTGQDACYFYNRLEGNAVRWVSYHFETEPELVLPDDEMVELLASLMPPEDVSA